MKISSIFVAFLENMNLIKKNDKDDLQKVQYNCKKNLIKKNDKDDLQKVQYNCKKF